MPNDNEGKNNNKAKTRLSPLTKKKSGNMVRTEMKSRKGIQEKKQEIKRKEKNEEKENSH